MEEKVFLNEGEVTVTNARFKVRAQTYAMSGITSVKSYEKRPSRLAPLTLILIGIMFGSTSNDALVGGIMFIALAMLWWMLSKTEFQVILSTASGEAIALKSEDSNWINRVVNALNEAIIYRG